MPHFFPSPEHELPHSIENTARLITRRRALAFLGIMAAGSSLFLTYDGIEAKQFWDNAVAEVHDVHSDERQRGDYKRGAFFLPGFDVANLDGAAHSQLPVLLPEHNYVGHITYGNEGLDIDQLYTAVRAKADKHDLERITLLCQSMGGPIGIELAAKLHEGGLLDDGIIVDRMFFYSSPFGPDDLQPESRKVIKGLAGNPVPTGPYTRFALETIERIQRGESLGDAIADTNKMLDSKSCSNELLESMASYLDKFDLARFKYRMPLETQYNYMCTSVPAQDQFVDVAKSVPTLQRTLLGIKNFFSSPLVGHADVTASPLQFADMTREGLARCAKREELLALPYPHNAGGI